MKMILKRVGELPQVVETDKRYQTEAVREFLPDVDIQQRVYLEDNMRFTMIVDENGLSKNLPLNFLMEMASNVYPVQLIVGDVVFVRTKYADPFEEELWDYEVEDVTAADLEKVKGYLAYDLQEKLIRRYMEWSDTWNGAREDNVC